MKKEVSICWLRRDLRLNDNAALYHALKDKQPVLVLFIFDQLILKKLSNKADARVTFIYQTLQKIQQELKQYGSSLLVRFGTPEEIWSKILTEYHVNAVYANHDYEPYARKRDDGLAEFLASEKIPFHTFKDQVIFEKAEIVKSDGKPYTVFTPYYRQWFQKLDQFYTRSYPSKKYFSNFLQCGELDFPTIEELGFENSS